MLNSPNTMRPTPISSNSDDSFGCCSRYRACSDAGECLISHLDYSLGCIYRRQLESGHVFYGKNADNFSSDEYAVIKNAVTSLSSDSAGVLDLILLNLCEYNRGASSCIVRNFALNELSALGLFQILPLGERFTALCSAKSLSQMVKSNPRFASRLDNQKSKRTSKSFLSKWLNTDAVDIRDSLAEPYRIVEVIPESARYIEELYQERLFSSDKQHIYSLSPLAEDGLLVNSEIEKERARCKLMSTQVVI